MTMYDADTAIRAEQLSKRYRIGSNAQRQDTIVGMMSSMVRAPLDNFRRLRRQTSFAEDGSSSSDTFWALRDATFEMKRGEVIGLVGRNGAGKSTTLKIISRIVEPTSGRCIINGRMSSLLEVGTGFHPDLTGRENVYFNGVLLGMSKTEMDRKFDEIVDFSGVERFIDTPVKRYSSGMIVRLAFAVAAHLEPEILLVDEVLAVGDATFQRKCMGKMEEVGRGGRTIVFVSHSMDAIRQLCPRALWFDSGVIRADGEVRDVTRQYLNSLNPLREDGSFRHEVPNTGLTIERISLRDAQGNETREFAPGDDVCVDIAYTAQQRVDLPYFVLGVASAKDSCFVANMLLDGRRPTHLEGEGVLRCRFKSVPLLPQSYSVKLMLFANDGKQILMEYQEVSTFTVNADLEEYGYRGEMLNTILPRSTAVVVPYEWTHPDGSVLPVSLASPK